MNCKKGWTHDTLDKFITKTFRNVDLKNHREAVLLEREKTLLPSSQPRAQLVVTLRKKKEELAAITKKRRELLYEINLLTQGKGEKVQEPSVATMNCPCEDCRGYVDGTTFVCGICSISVCKKCHEVKEDDAHKCKEENVQTTMMLKKDSKPCPSCAALIFKISGCSQMWCTQCHTTFDWNTGKSVEGVVHNPHYYEWLRNNGGVPRTEGDVPCGGIVNARHLLGALRKNKHSADMDNIMFVHRVTIHVQNVLLLDYPRTQYDELYNSDLRVKFLLNEITEQQFKVQLQQNEKKRVKQNEIHDILEVFLFTMIDIFNNIMHQCEQGTLDITSWLNQYDTLCSYVNEHLKKISLRFKCTVPCMHDYLVDTFKY